MATALIAAGEYLEAKALFEQSLAIARDALAAEHPDALYAMKGLNAVVQLIDRPAADSVERARKFLAAVEAQPDPKPSEVIFALNGLAVALQNTEHYTEAREVYLRALDVARQKLGSEDPIIASTLGNFSTTLLAHKQYSEAERYLRQALEITAKKPGRDSETYATQTSNLAAIYVAAGRRAEAVPLLREASENHGSPAPEGTSRPLGRSSQPRAPSCLGHGG